MTDSNFGELVLVPFPFTDLNTLKKRPALILSWVKSKTLPPLAIVAMVTSQIDSENIVGDYPLRFWKEAGLLHPSKIRLSKVVSLEEKLILRKMGILQEMDLKGIKKEFAKVFSKLL